MEKQTIPVVVVSGFLGSGKTTLLRRWIDKLIDDGLKPAVVMNELGDVNLDGEIIGGDIPMEELLGGCICCTISGDLGLALARIAEEETPDMILIESTGAANPMELIDGITEASLYHRISLSQVIIVVDGPHLLDLNRTGKGKTHRLMSEQIRCADLLLLNKTDLLSEEELSEIEEVVRELNAKAELVKTVQCEVDPALLMRTVAREHGTAARCDHHDCDHHDHDHSGHHRSHESHAHVMVYTHYFDSMLDSNEFERFIAELPAEVYRAKGILRFTDTASRYLFQYAYRQTDFLAIKPQKDVPDVLVLIGEHMNAEELEQKLRKLERSGGPRE